jgi:nucleotide-binding universal stress UspA family protein
MHQGFQKILLPIDDSQQSITSQKMAIFISKLFRSRVTLLHVISNELLTLGGRTYSVRENYAPISTAVGQFPRTIGLPQTKEYEFPEEIAREVTERLTDRGQTLLTNANSLFSKENISTTQKLVDNPNTAEAIITEAESGDYDLIIMGNSGSEENQDDLHLGSVAKKVSLATKTPVLVVRRKTKIRKILVPIDGSLREEKALQEASVIAEASGSQVLLLHVQEKSMLKIRPEINEIGFQILDQATKKMKETNVEQKLVSGDPAKMIIQTAEQQDFDLIIISSGDIGTIRGMLLGSVSDHMLHHATVPVLLIKQNREP